MREGLRDTMDEDDLVARAIKETPLDGARIPRIGPASNRRPDMAVSKENLPHETSNLEIFPFKAPDAGSGTGKIVFDNTSSGTCRWLALSGQRYDVVFEGYLIDSVRSKENYVNNRYDGLGRYTIFYGGELWYNSDRQGVAKDAHTANLAVNTPPPELLAIQLFQTHNTAFVNAATPLNLLDLVNAGNSSMGSPGAGLSFDKSLFQTYNKGLLLWLENYVDLPFASTAAGSGLTLGVTGATFDYPRIPNLDASFPPPRLQSAANGLLSKTVVTNHTQAAINVHDIQGCWNKMSWDFSNSNIGATDAYGPGCPIGFIVTTVGSTGNVNCDGRLILILY